MRPFWLLVRLRLADVAHPGVAAIFFGLPLALMLITGLVFGHGQPFERRRVAVVGPTPAALADYPELAPEPCESVEVARRRLATGVADAALVPGPRVLAGPRARLLARALADLLHAPPAEEVPVPATSYLQFLFPGLLTWTILVDGFLGMGYGLVRTRRSLFLKKLATTPTSPAVFVGAQILSRSALAFAQIAGMVAVASALGLPLAARTLPALALAVALGLATFMALGFALASVMTNESVFMDLVNACTVGLLLVSEVFFRVDAMPPWLASVAVALPSTQLVRVLRLIVLEGVTDPARLAAGFALLGAWAAVAAVAAVRTFRWFDE